MPLPLPTMCLGNQLGFEFIKPFQDTERLFTLQPGGMVLELADGTSIEELFDGLDCMLLGHLTAEPVYLHQRYRYQA